MALICLHSYFECCEIMTATNFVTWVRNEIFFFLVMTAKLWVINDFPRNTGSNFFRSQFFIVPITSVLRYLVPSFRDLFLQSLSRTKVLTTPTCPQPTASHHFLHQLSAPQYPKWIESRGKNNMLQIEKEWRCCFFFVPSLFPPASWSWWGLRGSWQEQASHSSWCGESKLLLAWKDEKMRKRRKGKEITNTAVKKNRKKKEGELTERDHVMRSITGFSPCFLLVHQAMVWKRVSINTSYKNEAIASWTGQSVAMGRTRIITKELKTIECAVIQETINQPLI